MSNDNQDKVPQIVESLSDETKDEIDPMVKSDMEARMKYGGLRPKVKAVAQRKISQGGTQYFDSGDYNAASRQDHKAEIADNPKPVINPVTARLRGQKRSPNKPLSPLSSSGPIQTRFD
jgi:hypothetical protein